MNKAKLYLAVDKCPHGTMAISINNKVGGTRLTVGCCGSWTTQKAFSLTPQGLNGIIKQLSEYTPDNEVVRLTKEVEQLKKERDEAREQALRVVRGDFAQICSYCGWEAPAGGASWEQLQEHVFNCEAHPLKKAVDALNYIAGSVGSRDHEREVARGGLLEVARLLSLSCVPSASPAEVEPPEEILKPLMPCAQKCDGCGARFRCLDAGVPIPLKVQTGGRLGGGR